MASSWHPSRDGVGPIRSRAHAIRPSLAQASRRARAGPRRAACALTATGRRRTAQRAPEVDRPVAVELEVRLHDADDGGRLTVHKHRLAKDVRGGLKGLLPVVVAEGSATCGAPGRSSPADTTRRPRHASPTARRDLAVAPIATATCSASPCPVSVAPCVSRAAKSVRLRTCPRHSRNWAGDASPRALTSAGLSKSTQPREPPSWMGMARTRSGLAMPKSTVLAPIAEPTVSTAGRWHKRACGTASGRRERERERERERSDIAPPLAHLESPRPWAIGRRAHPVFGPTAVPGGKHRLPPIPTRPPRPVAVEPNPECLVRLPSRYSRDSGAEGPRHNPASQTGGPRSH